MSQNPVAVASSRVRCSHCSRFVFRNSTCRCRKPSPVYHPKTNGLLPAFRPDPEARQTPDVEVTVRHRGPLDANGNWSSWGQGEDL